MKSDRTLSKTEVDMMIFLENQIKLEGIDADCFLKLSKIYSVRS